MNSIFYIVIVVILSHQKVDVIYNKVTKEEIKKSELGWQSSKRILNSKKDILSLKSEIKDFKGENNATECFLNFAGKDAGWISQFLDTSKMPSEMDVKEYSIINNLPIGNDEDIIRYCQSKLLK